MNSRIEWTDETWNPTTGCTRVSAGCDNCYAAVMTNRLGAMAEADRAKGRDPGRKAQYEGLTVLNPRGDRHFNGTVRCNDDALTIPMGWKKPRRVFVDSMSDLFHPEVPFEFITRVFAVMALCPQHTFQILTKRPERMAAYLTMVDRDEAIGHRAMKEYEDNGGRGDCSIAAGLLHGPGRVFDHPAVPNRPKAWPLPNVWLGTSVEDQPAADERIPWLLQCPAAVRFLSCEPLLGPVDLDSVWPGGMPGPFDGAYCNGIHWVIVGGESGAKARPMHPDWARDLRDQCQAAGVAYFFKQWGTFSPGGDYYDDDDERRDAALDRSHILVTADGNEWSVGTPGTDEPHDGQPPPGTWIMCRVGKKAAGRLLDGREWNDMPTPAENE